MQDLKNQIPLTVSIVLPAKNEAQNLGALLLKLKALALEAEILVVNDGSTDATAQIAQDLGVRVITHRYSLGNGAAVKTGARNATGNVVVFMDADGQHDPDDIPLLLEKLNTGYNMVVVRAIPAPTAANYGDSVIGFIIVWPVIWSNIELKT